MKKSFFWGLLFRLSRLSIALSPLPTQPPICVADNCSHIPPTHSHKHANSTIHTASHHDSLLPSGTGIHAPSRAPNHPISAETSESTTSHSSAQAAFCHPQGHTQAHLPPAGQLLLWYSITTFSSSSFPHQPLSSTHNVHLPGS